MKFQLGQLVATPNALSHLSTAGISPASLLARHAKGDWGDLDTQDRKANDAALLDGGRIFSAYKLPDGGKIWIVTEAEDDQRIRRSTCILMPSDY